MLNWNCSVVIGRGVCVYESYVCFVFVEWLGVWVCILWILKGVCVFIDLVSICIFVVLIKFLLIFKGMVGLGLGRIG